MQPLNAELGQIYAQALVAIARVDGEIGGEEGARLRELVANRTSVEIDHEASFFEKVTPDALAAAVGRASQRARTRASVARWSAMRSRSPPPTATSTAVEAQAILRYARALGCTDEEIGAETRELDEWL